MLKDSLDSVRDVLHQLVEDIRNIRSWYQSQHHEASHPGVDRRVDLCTSGRISSECFILGLVTKLVDIPEDCLAEVQVAAINLSSRE